MLLPILSGILGILTFLPFKFFYLFGFVFLIPLFIFLSREEKIWRLIFGTAVFRVIFGLGVVYYTFEPLTWFFSALIFLGLAVSVFFSKKITKSSGVLLFFLPFFWTVWDILEAEYSFLPTYVMTLGNAFGTSPFVGLAGIGGIGFLTLFAASVNGAGTYLISKLKTKDLKLKTVVVDMSLILFFLIAGWLASQFVLQKNALNYYSRNDSLKIATVSADENFNPNDWRKPGQWQEFNQELAAEFQNRKIDLLILPEDIYYFGLGPDYAQTQNELAVSSLAKELKTNVLASFDTAEQQKRYNSAVLFDEQGRIADSRHKSRLTFIGEYWPFGDWHPFFFDWLKSSNPNYQNYVVFNSDRPYSTADSKILILKNNGQDISFAAPICLEIQYPNDIQSYKKMGARFIVNPTSNRWLDLGTEHFLYLSDNLKKIEAVWLKIPIVSAGVKEFAGITLPDGKSYFADYKKSQDKHFNIFFGKIKI